MIKKAFIIIIVFIAMSMFLYTKKSHGTHICLKIDNEELYQVYVCKFDPSQSSEKCNCLKTTKRQVKYQCEQ